MKILQFTIEINASKEKVWDTMLKDNTYRQWASVFSPGSYFKGDWSKGSKMFFLGPHPETGVEGGMTAIVAENHPYKYISLKYSGLIQNGIEDTGIEAQKWTPGYENYTFSDSGGITTLVVDLKVADEFAGMFEESWPKALAKLKQIVENS